MPTELDITPFLERSRHTPVFDVRTPAEFSQGHIPGAHNLPLFSDEERAEVGTLYKQQGREVAIRRGLDLIGPRLRSLVETAEIQIPGNEVLVHCWRGGMRSGSMAWLLELVGYQVGTLRGGYKAFRRYALEAFDLLHTVHLLGGMTGSRKTEVLRELARRGEQVLDLEAVAHHKGSVFGHLGEREQPSQEHFENQLAVQWRAFDTTRPVWIEDESRRIGRLLVPGGLWAQMQHTEVYVLDVPLKTRVEHLVSSYGIHNADGLLEAIGTLHKRMGGLRTSQAQQAVRDGDLHTACRLLLAYYDRAYTYGLDQRSSPKKHLPPAPSPSTPATLADLVLDATLCL